MVSAYFSGMGISLITEDEEGSKKPQIPDEDYSSVILVCLYPQLPTRAYSERYRIYILAFQTRFWDIAS